MVCRGTNGAISHVAMKMNAEMGTTTVIWIGRSVKIASATRKAVIWAIYAFAKRNTSVTILTIYANLNVTQHVDPTALVQLQMCVIVTLDLPEKHVWRNVSAMGTATVILKKPPKAQSTVLNACSVRIPRAQNVISVMLRIMESPQIQKYCQKDVARVVWICAITKPLSATSPTSYRMCHL